MALINLKTNLKSLKYGRDTVDGGDSKQPLVKTSIPESFSEIGNTGGFDNIFRGGALIGTAVANDSLRIGKLTNTLTIPQGAAFKTKMNLLSNMNVQTQVKTQKYNQGEYRTTNTLAQIATDPFGYHFPLFSGPLSYFDAVKNQQSGDTATGRLVDFYNSKINTKVQGTELYSYPGGPGSEKGNGRTVINLAGDRTGRNNPKLIDFYGDAGVRNPLFDQLNTGDLLIGNENPNTAEPEFLVNPVTALGFQAFKRTQITDLKTAVWASGITNLLYSPADNQASNTLKNQYRQSTTTVNKLPGNSQGATSNPKQILNQADKGTSTLLSNDQIRNKTLYQGGVTPPADFREDLKELKDQAYKVQSFNRVKSYKVGDPGSKTLNKKKDINTLRDYRVEKTAFDDINFKRIIPQKQFKTQDAESDIIPFYITLIKYNGENQVMQFRAYVKGFSDSYTGEWNATRFAGRGENFYTYGGFNREISLSFTVHAQTKAELLSNYEKLNYLASTLAPDYGKGFMRGNFLRLTYGDYIKDIPGVLKGMTFSIPDNTPWDIGRNADGTRTKVGNVELEDRLPHLIQVNSFNFAPIHDFVPQLGSPFIHATNETNINNYSSLVRKETINVQAQESQNLKSNTEVRTSLSQTQITGGAPELNF